MGIGMFFSVLDPEKCKEMGKPRRNLGKMT